MPVVNVPRPTWPNTPTQTKSGRVSAYNSRFGTTPPSLAAQAAAGASGIPSVQRPTNPTANVGFWSQDDRSYYGQDDDTMKRVQDALMPYWSTARENMKAYLADQGLVSSTGGATRMRDEVEMPFAQASNTMYQDILDKQKAAAFAREQFETESSMNLYNLLWSQFFNQWQLKGTDKGLKAPKDFPLFGDLFGSRYTDPYKSTSGPTGDANTEYVPRYSPNQGKTQGAKDSDASQAYQNAYLGFLKQQEANDNAQWKAGFDYTTGQTENESDPWSIMTDSAILNLQNNPEASGVKTLSGDELSQAFYSKFNIDIASLAAKGDPRAQKLYALIYGHAYNETASPLAGAAVGSMQPSSALGDIGSLFGKLGTSAVAVSPVGQVANSLGGLSGTPSLKDYSKNPVSIWDTLKGIWSK